MSAVQLQYPRDIGARYYRSDGIVVLLQYAFGTWYDSELARYTSAGVAPMCPMEHGVYRRIHPHTLTEKVDGNP